MLSLKLLVLDTLIENFVHLLCREDSSPFFEVYLDWMEQLTRIRRSHCSV